MPNCRVAVASLSSASLIFRASAIYSVPFLIFLSNPPRNSTSRLSLHATTLRFGSVLTWGLLTGTPLCLSFFRLASTLHHAQPSPPAMHARGFWRSPRSVRCGACGYHGPLPASILAGLAHASRGPAPLFHAHASGPVLRHSILYLPDRTLPIIRTLTPCPGSRLLSSLSTLGYDSREL